ncbi:MAG: DUF6069 family protein [Actinophytocola sp.]|uniref:DUF6069 family protein n=1 Tax=Actinophytocola sp. TaxID=1872138 RepID=UPI003C70A6D8
MTDPQQPSHGKLDPARLWSGGAATAVVAALIAVVGILLCRSVLDVPVLSPKGEGVWGDARTVTFALVAGGIALAATALMQLLSVTTPQFPTFFTWIMVLLTAIAVVIPLSLPVGWDAKLATAGINLVIGIAITSILQSVARSAYRRAPHPPSSEPGSTGVPGMPPPWQST